MKESFIKRISPAWFLFLAAPVTAEYISGSSSIFNPIFIVINLLLYGCGVLLIRELKTKWRTGWLSVFLMSIAYTIFEEGLMLNTLFDPTQNTVGRFLGVNWVWTAGIFIIHSLVSVSLPILLAESLYPERAREAWIKPRTFIILLVLFLSDVFILGTLILPHNRPGGLYYLVEILIIAACLWAARKTSDPQTPPAGATHSPRWYYFSVLASFSALMIVSFVAPSLALPAFVIIAVMAAAYAIFIRFLFKSGALDAHLPPASAYAISAGVITFWIVVSPLKAFEGVLSPLITAILAAIFLVLARPVI